MDREKIINVMESKAEEIYNANEKYQANGKRGLMVVQIRSNANSEMWESSILSFGRLFDPGFSYDTTVHEKIAYVRRTGKNSGELSCETVGTESHWTGALISDDGNCICAFSGFEGDDDVLIARAGISEYCRLKNV